MSRFLSSALPENDSENRFLSVYPRRRLSVESMRDTMLAISGELNLRVGGPPKELFGEGASTRRSIYGKIDRQFLPSVLRVFDFANPELHAPRRYKTNVPQQALFLMNSKSGPSGRRNFITPKRFNPITIANIEMLEVKKSGNCPYI